MANTVRYDPDTLERQERLSKRGKLPKTTGSRRSDLIRAIVDSEREEMEMYDDDMYYLEMLEMGTL